MQIIIVGCGAVGTTIIAQLSKEDHNITVIDMDGEELKEKLGAAALQGAAEDDEMTLNAEASDAEEHRKSVQKQAEKIAARSQ